MGAIQAQSQMSYNSEIPRQQLTNSDLLKLIENFQQPVAAPSSSALSISIFMKLSEISEKLDKLISMQLFNSQHQTHGINIEPLSHNTHVDRPPHTGKNRQADGIKSMRLFAVKTTSAKHLIKEENNLSIAIEKTKPSQDSNVETTTETILKSDQLLESHSAGDPNHAS